MIRQFQQQKLHVFQFQRKFPKSVNLHSEKWENYVNGEFSNDSELKFIDDYAFWNTKIDKITIPTKVTRIGKLELYYCKNLKNIEIPTNSYIPQYVIKIESFAFYKCQNLEIVDIPLNSEFGNDIFLDKGNNKRHSLEFL